MIRIQTLSHPLVLRNPHERIKLQTLPTGSKLFLKGKRTDTGMKGRIFTAEGWTIKQHALTKELSKLKLREWIALAKLLLKK
jgi:hypothetical protein